jgi:putative peptidoglycan lipid II flippase
MATATRTRRLAGAAAIVMAAYVSSRLTGLLREIVIGYRFGTTRELDAYLAAARVPDLVFQLIAGAAVASAFIPVYSGYLSRGKQREAWDMVSTLFTLTLVVLLPLIALVMVGAPWLMRLLAPDFPSPYQALAANLARIVLLAPIFFTLGSFATSMLNSHGRFFLAAVAPTCYNVGLIVGAVVLSRWLGIYGLALGGLLGSIAFFLVQLPGLRQIGLVYRPQLRLAHPGVRAMARLIGPRALGLAVAQVNFVVTLYLASGIPGGVAALNYAWLLTMLPLGVFAMAISTAVFPSLAEQGAVRDHAGLAHMVQQALHYILYLTIPASIGLMTLSPAIVRLVYQRGEFNAASTLMTAASLRFYAAGLIGMAATEIVTRSFYALHDTRTPVKIAAVGMAVNLIGAVALVQPLGLDGLALATALASTVEAVALFQASRHRLPELDVDALLRSAWKSATGAFVMSVAVVAFAAAATSLDRPLNGAFLVVGAVVVGGAVYLLVTAVLGSAELRQLRQLMGPRARMRS